MERPKQAGRKSQQLCRQVKDALHSAFAACGDPAVQAATCGRGGTGPAHRPVAGARGAPADFDRDAMVEGVARASGFMRSEVAASISRRHTPELVFEVIVQS